MTETTHHAFYPGFAWAVPRVFADPLAACRFEKGDTLHDRPDAYARPWDEVRREGRAIQVLEPSRGIGAPAGGQDESAFAEAWQQEVVFDLHDFAAGEVTTVTTTQGRLYTLLWKDERAVLGIDAPAPDMPLNANTFKKHLEIAATRLGPLSGTTFLMATDEAAGLRREKLHKVSLALAEGFGARPELIPAGELELDAEFLPTVHLARFDLGTVGEEEVTAALQAVLYKPSAGRSTEVSRFRLATHGLLLLPDPT